MEKDKKFNPATESEEYNEKNCAGQLFHYPQKANGFSGFNIAFNPRREWGADSVRKGITYHELDVLTLYGMGMSNADIAKQMGIKEQTVKNHLTTLQKKIGANNRTQTLMMAVQQGMIRLEFGFNENGEKVSDDEVTVVFNEVNDDE
ncbi:helix-turn-helix transcriptional regulator [Dehalococcoides mccartyi]|uniref:response regulator transcription factor n=1 Tax=Dehalococcoides mccartyi TaxID=61435 RepID=UPI0002B7738E|nr:LuxR C-terminal-related transcriptional regulator [Dehalococcoides mccartyi]AGG07889.1 LuxR domain-containing protein [Dehalococcoides mccartyi BTF08]AQU05893.1 helix-turn-helix transcriptional regulator [Dehalococcoides mccartyi]AQU07338.1 helix-turn-helix transcriptional regulator [Dehalococcoides mccartyi]AQW62441.1 helix-turn-helix transcriptional regulator [Dehalococcoides mccartyi]